MWQNLGNSWTSEWWAYGSMLYYLSTSECIYNLYNKKKKKKKNLISREARTTVQVNLLSNTNLREKINGLIKTKINGSWLII